MNTNYKNKDVQGQDFSGLDLSYANFMGADVSNCKFIGTILEGANFVNAKMEGTDFTDATCYFMNDKNSTGKAKWNNARCFGVPKHRVKNNTNNNRPNKLKDRPDKIKEGFTNGKNFK